MADAGVDMKSILDQRELETLYIALKPLLTAPQSGLDVLFGQRWVDGSFTPTTMSIEAMLQLFLSKSLVYNTFQILKIKHDVDDLPQLYVSPISYREEPCDKIHIMFRKDGLPFVLNRLFSNLSVLHIQFKIVSPYPLGYYKEWSPFPYINGSDMRMDYGKDLSRLNPLTPDEIYSAPIRNSGYDTYMYNGKSYEFEHVFTPTLVCYVPHARTKDVLALLLQLFSDDDPTFNMFRMPNFYPRFNVKINTMIYIGIGEGHDKMHFGFKHDPCNYSKDNRMECISDDVSPYTIPDEYKAIQDKCTSLQSKSDCDVINDLPKTVSHSTLCRWQDDTCQVTPVYSPNVLVSTAEPSLAHLYKRIGQERIWTEWNNDAGEDVVYGKKGNRKTRRNRSRVFHKKRR